MPAATAQPPIAAECACSVVLVIASFLFCRWWQRDAENTRNDAVAWAPSAPELPSPRMSLRRTSSIEAALPAAQRAGGRRQSRVVGARPASDESPPRGSHVLLFPTASHDGAELSPTWDEAARHSISRPSMRIVRQDGDAGLPGTSYCGSSKAPALNRNEMASSDYPRRKSPVSGAARREAHLLKRRLGLTSSADSLYDDRGG